MLFVLMIEVPSVLSARKRRPSCFTRRFAASSRIEGGLLGTDWSIERDEASRIHGIERDVASIRVLRDLPQPLRVVESAQARCDRPRTRRDRCSTWCSFRCRSVPGRGVRRRTSSGRTRLRPSSPDVRFGFDVNSCQPSVTTTSALRSSRTPPRCTIRSESASSVSFSRRRAFISFTMVPMPRSTPRTTPLSGHRPPAARVVPTSTAPA